MYHHDFPDEDADSDYQSCESLISNEDVERATAWTDVQELEYQWIEDVWVLVAARYFTGFGVMFLIVTLTMMLSLCASPTNTGWISGPERFKAMPVKEVVKEAMAVLAETIGGHASRWWQCFLAAETFCVLVVSYI